jgi:ApeA N-terminal domain 1
MTTTERLEVLRSGAVVRGEFWIAGTKLERAGTLEWSFQRGAILRLIGDTKGWPTDLGQFHHTIHGILEGVDDVTLLYAGVRRTALVDRPTMFSGTTLAFGSHINPETRWSRAIYETANLAGWVADSGLDPHRGQSGAVDGMFMRPPRRRSLHLPRADAWLSTEHDAAPFGYVGAWSVQVRQVLVVDVRRRASLEDLHHRYAIPLLCFTSFASDRPDCLTTEVVLNLDSRERAEIWRSGPRVDPEPWSTVRGYLFWANELPRLSAAFTRWWRLHAASPALGLFADHINLGLSYSAPRFLTLFTAMEGYCRSRLGQKDFKRMRDHAAVDVNVHGCTKDALAAARRYAEVRRAPHQAARSGGGDRGRAARLDPPRPRAHAGLPIAGHRLRKASGTEHSRAPLCELADTDAVVGAFLLTRRTSRRRQRS